MSSERSKLAPVQEIGYSFLRSYYSRLHEDPKNLHHLYSEKANAKCINYPFLKDDQTNFLPQTVKITGKSNLSEFFNKHEEKIKDLRFRIDTHEVQSTGVDESGVFILAMGELCWKNSPSYRFVQTFILSHVSKNVFDITNDLIKFIPDDIVPKIKRVVPAKAKVEIKQEDTVPIQSEQKEVVAPTQITKETVAKKEAISNPKEDTEAKVPESVKKGKSEKEEKPIKTKPIISEQQLKEDVLSKEAVKEKLPKKEEHKQTTVTPALAPAASSVVKETTPTPPASSQSSLSPLSKQGDENEDFRSVTTKKNRTKYKENQSQQQLSDTDDGYTVATYGNKHGSNNSKKRTTANKYGTFPVYITKTTDLDEDLIKTTLKTNFGSVGNIFLGPGFVIADFEHESSQKKALDAGFITVAPGRALKIGQKTESKNKYKNINSNGSSSVNSATQSSSSFNGGQYITSSSTGLYNNTYTDDGFTTVTSSGFTATKSSKNKNYKKN